MTQEAFREQIANKTMGHVGLLESLYLVAETLGLSLDDVQEAVEPVVAQKELKTAYFSLKPGDVAGIKHTAEGMKNGEKILTLDLRMFVGCESPYDAVHIVGTPEIRLRIEGGIAGDQATAAVLVNSIPAVVAARPGLATVKDLPAPRFYR
jgi:4-hydroxy-tetrahydrodipicolinate reductase